MNEGSYPSKPCKCSSDDCSSRYYLYRTYSYEITYSQTPRDYVVSLTGKQTCSSISDKNNFCGADKIYDYKKANSECAADPCDTYNAEDVETCCTGVSIITSGTCSSNLSPMDNTQCEQYQAQRGSGTFKGLDFVQPEYGHTDGYSTAGHPPYCTTRGNSDGVTNGDTWWNKQTTSTHPVSTTYRGVCLLKAEGSTRRRLDGSGQCVYGEVTESDLEALPKYGAKLLETNSYCKNTVNSSRLDIYLRAEEDITENKHGYINLNSPSACASYCKTKESTAFYLYRAEGREEQCKCATDNCDARVSGFDSTDAYTIYGEPIGSNNTYEVDGVYEGYACVHTAKASISEATNAGTTANADGRVNSPTREECASFCGSLGYKGFILDPVTDPAHQCKCSSDECAQRTVSANTNAFTIKTKVTVTWQLIADYSICQEFLKATQQDSTDTGKHVVSGGAYDGYIDYETPQECANFCFAKGAGAFSINPYSTDAYCICSSDNCDHIYTAPSQTATFKAYRITN